MSARFETVLKEFKMFWPIKNIFCICVQSLINHKSDIKHTFAIKIITDKNKFDATLFLIYVKIYVYEELCWWRSISITKLIIFLSEMYNLYR